MVKYTWNIYSGIECSGRFWKLEVSAEMGRRRKEKRAV